MTARCQSSGTFLSIHAFWKMEVSQVMYISPLARMALVVIPSIPLTLVLRVGLYCLLDFRSENDWLLIVVFVAWVELGLVLRVFLGVEVFFPSGFNIIFIIDVVAIFVIDSCCRVMSHLSFSWLSHSCRSCSVNVCTAH